MNTLTTRRNLFKVLFAFVAAAPPVIRAGDDRKEAPATYGQEIVKSEADIIRRWKAECRRMIAERRKDPTAIHAIPFRALYK